MLQGKSEMWWAVKCSDWEGDPLHVLKEVLHHSPASRAGARDWHLGEILCYEWAEVGVAHFKCVSQSAWSVLFGCGSVQKQHWAQRRSIVSCKLLS